LVGDAKVPAMVGSATVRLSGFRRMRRAGAMCGFLEKVLDRALSVRALLFCGVICAMMEKI